MEGFSRSRRVASCLVAVVVLACCAAPVAGVGDYDPCAGQPAMGKGDAFTLGIAYYPGGSTEAWGALHPCLYADRAALAAKGVASMVFRPELDAMAFFRGSQVDEQALFASVPGAQIMTLVAYAGNGTAVVRSQPRVVRSSSSSATMLGSAVGRVNSLTLIARFDKGELQYLQWHDMGCGSCADGDACLAVGGDVTGAGGGHTACAGTEEACTCAGANCLLDLAGTDVLRCHLTVAAAFSGTDKFSVPLKSGAQIERLGKYSATKAAKGAGANALASATSLRSAASGVTGK